MKKKGISLIVLVITIVVIIILAAAVILALGQNNPITSSRIASIASTRDSIESSILLYSANVQTKTLGGLSVEKILTNSEHKITTDASPVTVEMDDETVVLYAIDYNLAKSKLNLELKNEGNGIWHVDKNGKVYLLYVNEDSMPQYLQDEEAFSTVSGYVALKTPKHKKYSASDIANITTEEERRTVLGKSVSLESTNGWTNWKVFGSDGTNIMLIAGDYIPISILPSNHGFEVRGAYTVCSYTSRADLMSKLRNATTFLGFKDANGKVIEARIPTIEDFAKSYNLASHAGPTYNYNGVVQRVYYKDNGQNGGYNVASGSAAASNDAVTTSMMWTGYGLPTTETYYGNLWVISDSSKYAYEYWLATESSSGTEPRDVLTVEMNGAVYTAYYYYGYVGLRPVVVLGSNVKLVQNIDDDDNITYTLK